MRYFIEFSYNGKDFFGWQIQRFNISVEEVLEKRLSILLDKSINIIGASRTDKGVHAKQMFAHFDFDKEIKNSFVIRLNKFLPLSINVFRIFKVKNYIHARFDALSRTYQYIISIGKNPFYNEISWIWLNGFLSIDKMNEASYFLTKKNDFSIFCKKRSKNKNNICNIYKCDWIFKKNILLFTIESNRFLRNMVRSIVGTIVEIGRGKLKIEDFIEKIKYNKKNKNTNTAPAKGLFLTKIKYSKYIYY